MRSRLPLAALLGGLASGCAVAAIFLLAGVGDDEETAAAPRPAPAPTVQPAPAPRTSTPTIRELYRNARQSVFVVEGRQPGIEWPEGPPREDDGVATGTGFAIEGGRIVTNEHVVSGAELVAVRLQGERVHARVIGSDPSTDLALLRLPRAQAGKLAALELGRSAQVQPVETAVAIGNPHGLTRTLTAGVISAVGRSIQAPDGSRIRNVIQTDAAVNPGNSGGPLLDAQGRVIGVLAQSRGDGLSFAVPVDTLKRIAPELQRRGEVRRAYLGVTTSGPERGPGALVTEAIEGAPAARAGLRSGDVILSLGEDRIGGPAALVAAVEGERPGTRIQLEFRRGSTTRSVEVELAQRPRPRTTRTLQEFACGRPRKSHCGGRYSR